jgi:hypothetical protein
MPWGEIFAIITLLSLGFSKIGLNIISDCTFGTGARVSGIKDTEGPHCPPMTG